MLLNKKACFKAALVVILLFSLFNVGTLAMPTDTTPALWITNSSNASGITVLEPGNSLTDGNWIVLGGGNTIRVPKTSFSYSGPGVLSGGHMSDLLSSMPFVSGFGIGTTYEISNASLHDLTVPLNTYQIYVDDGSKDHATATYYGSSDYANKILNVKLLDLTKVSGLIDFTNMDTIKNTAKTLTLDDIKATEIQSADMQANASGDIPSIQTSITNLNGMSHGYYMLVVTDHNSDPNILCIVAEMPIIVTKSDMTVNLPMPGQPGNCSFIL